MTRLLRSILFVSITPKFNARFLIFLLLGHFRYCLEFLKIYPCSFNFKFAPGSLCETISNITRLFAFSVFFLLKKATASLLSKRAFKHAKTIVFNYLTELVRIFCLNFLMKMNQACTDKVVLVKFDLIMDLYGCHSKSMHGMSAIFDKLHLQYAV